jgi:O-glycosyl hydrolase
VLKLTVAGVAMSLATASPAPAPASARRNASGRVGVVVTTTHLSRRLARRPSLRWSRGAPSYGRVIRVDDSKRYQRMEGFGASVTDSSAWLIATKLSPAAHASLMRDLFGPSGIHLSYVRVPIGASDFTRDGVPYTYDDTPGGLPDPTLANFSIEHDRAYVLPILREMLSLNPSASILASPWTAPPWMKANDAYSNDHGGGTLASSAYGPLAQYFVRFLQDYSAAGVPVRAVTPQNEPGIWTSRYPGMNLSPAEEARFVADYLAPALQGAGLRTEIYGVDIGWDARSYVHDLLADSRAARALTGLSWHCYAGSGRTMSDVHRRFPGLEQGETECSSPIAPGFPAEMVIDTARHWGSTAQLWNLALNGHFGPVQRTGCGGCTGVVEIDERTGRVTRTRDYYQLAQASRFVAVGARRIGSNTFVGYPETYFHQKGPYATADVDNAAFRNPDGSHALLVYNNARRRKAFTVAWRGRSFRYALPGRATATFTW